MSAIGEYEGRFEEIESEIDKLRTSFISNDTQEPLNTDIMAGRIDELEEGEAKRLQEIHRLNKQLQEEKHKMIASLGLSTLPPPLPPPLGEQKVDPAVIPQSPSQQRVRAMRSSGLSELSKQLGVSQAKNEAQGVEISRLERQLRILADLQGISVADLRKALEQACENEAFGEMQHRVAKLSAELEAATLMKQVNNPKGMMSTSSKGTPTATSADSSEEVNGLKSRIQELHDVELQLRTEIQRLLQVEKSQQAEIDSLKTSQAALTSGVNAIPKTTGSSDDSKLEEIKLQAQRQQEEIENLKSQLQKKDDDFSILMKDFNTMARAMLVKDNTIAKTKEELETERKKSQEHISTLDHDARQSRAELLAEKQRSMRKLQDLDQQKRKSEVDNQQQLKDMEQQLKSLYAAVGCLNEDHDAEKSNHLFLRDNLHEADTVVALKMAQEQTQNGAATANTNTAGQQSGELYNSLLWESLHQHETQKPAARTSQATTSAASSTEFYNGYNPPDTVLPEALEILISGELLVKSKGIVRKWKQKRSRLYVSGDHYRWDLGEGKSFLLEFGISRVEYNPNHPLSFVVYTNPNSSDSPVIHAAAVNEDDYHRWMSALATATTGGD